MIQNKGNLMEQEKFERNTAWQLANTARDARKTARNYFEEEKSKGERGLFARLIEDSFSQSSNKNERNFDNQFANIREYEKSSEESLLLRPLGKDEILSTNQFEESERYNGSWSIDRHLTDQSKRENKSNFTFF